MLSELPPAPQEFDETRHILELEGHIATGRIEDARSSLRRILLNAADLGAGATI